MGAPVGAQPLHTASFGNGFGERPMVDGVEAVAGGEQLREDDEVGFPCERLDVIERASQVALRVTQTGLD
jgi:hypothetical protein